MRHGEPRVIVTVSVSAFTVARVIDGRLTLLLREQEEEEEKNMNDEDKKMYK